MTDRPDVGSAGLVARPARWFAPGRVNLIGEHTDYNDGFALPFALELGCRAEVLAGSGRPGLRIVSGQEATSVWVAGADLHPGAGWLRGPDGWAGYVAGAVWALCQTGHLDRSGVIATGLTIVVDSGVPVGAGLSSSAALCCSTVGAVADAFGMSVSARELAELARRAEAEFVGAPTGGMDQLASALGAKDQAVLCDLATGQVEAVPFALGSAGLALVVVDTGAPHAHVDGEYGRRRASCVQAATELGLPSLRAATESDLVRLSSAMLKRRVRHVITENARVLAVAARLRAGDVAGIAPLLTESHASMRDDFEITSDRVDLAVTSLLSAGALGARMTGGGFGGSVIALLDARRVAPAIERVGADFAAAGFARPSAFVARPGAGAHRLRTSAAAERSTWR